MNKLSIECSLPILAAELSFTTNDSKDIARETANSLHCQIVHWLKALTPDSDADRTSRFASGASYTNKQGDAKYTRLDTDLTLKPGAEYPLALVAAERMHETVLEWVCKDAAN